MGWHRDRITVRTRKGFRENTAYRITLLHPYGQGFWWLLSEPPLYVVLVGILFHWLVAPGLVEDVEQHERGGSQA